MFRQKRTWCCIFVAVLIVLSKGAPDDAGSPDDGGLIGWAPGDGVMNDQTGKAMCVFKNSADVQGGIILAQEHIQSRMQVIGKLKGLKKGTHVLTFHSKGDVHTPGCRGVGRYHRPSVADAHLVHRRSTNHHHRGKRQLELFRLGEKYVQDAYDMCMRHVASCKQKKLTTILCEFHMKNCLPVLKCKTCKAKAKTVIETYDTIGDLEETGHFKYRSGIPKKSLTVYADENGNSDFKEEEREQTLHGPDSVIGKSILLSALPSDPNGNFKGIACCQIQAGCPTVL